MFIQIALSLLLVALLGWAYWATHPPPPKICGSPGGPPVTAPRIKLSDGRHLAYLEMGVPKEKAKYKVIAVHGISSSKDLLLPVSRELIEELGIYILAYDRAGYSESDPNPERSVKSEAFDLEELADQLEIGHKFYVIGISMGCYTVWSCLKYIPDRLAGAALISPVVNYWWPSLPSELSKEVYRKLLFQTQWGLRVAHYTPRLLYWLASLSSMSNVSRVNPALYNHTDMEIIRGFKQTPFPGREKVTQQGDFESIVRDILVGYGNWDFDPLDLVNPFVHNESSVHIWQGYEDKIIPALLQRYVPERLPWIKYHEVPYAGHLLVFTDTLCDAIFRALLIGEEQTFM